DHPLKHMEHKGIFDSRCSGHMTGNRAHLEDYQELSKVGSVTFGGSKGSISGKGIAWMQRRNLVLTDSEEEEPEAQGRKSQDDPLDSSVQGLVTPPTTKVNTSREEQVEEISPNTLEAAKTLSKVASLKSRSIEKWMVYQLTKFHVQRIDMVINQPWNLPFLGAKGLTSPEQTAIGKGI
ncbi:hypothetical protein Tco_0275113, partial [Tanacetum coccineum]